jgi:DNA modification methylase
MSLATYHVGDVFDVLRTLPDDSVDLVLTSPPFLALRSYLPDDHPDKGREIGQELTPASFLDTLLALTAEWDRVLTPHGSVAVELGDTYAGGGGEVASREHQAEREGTGADGGARSVPMKEGQDWPLAKSLCGIPELYAFSLAYGRNLLTGEDSSAGMWRVRNLVRWVRPNPPVGALGDKFRPATSTMTIACRSRTRWFDLDAVREPGKHPNAIHYVGNVAANRGDAGDPSKRIENNPAGVPPLDWWEVPTSPYKGSHYATWPPALCVRPIESMCPREVCRTCGEPRRRMVEHERTFDNVTASAGRSTAGTNGGAFGNSYTVTRSTTGWTDCGHDDYRRGVVLDPFAGSGTTLAVATGHGRDAVGIDLDERNADLARNRVGMFLGVVER